jgi:replicative DNA helicase
MGHEERMLPQNIEAEMGVLGSIIIDPEALVEVVDFLHAEDFYRDAHRTIFEVILDLYNRREPADHITICNSLERRNQLENIGGARYITSLINYVPTSGNAYYYGQIVERTAILRRLIHTAGIIAAEAYQAQDEQASAMVDRAEHLVFEIGQRATSQGDDLSISEVMTAYMAKLEELSERRGTLIGVPSGFMDLDRLTGGFRGSDVIVLAARPSVGKTSCALSIVHQAAMRYQKRIGIFSLEMSTEQLGERLLAIETGINLQRLNTGDIEDDEWEQVITALGRISELPIRLDGTSVMSPIQMRSRARKWMIECGLDMIVIDYLQLMQESDPSKRKQANRVQIIDEISRNLKLLARELNIPILVLAQLSRTVEQRMSKLPQLSDLRESGGIEQNADIVIFIYREEMYNPETERRGYADLIVAKHRNGPTGQVVLRFDAKTTRFLDPDPSDPALVPVPLTREEEIDLEDLRPD